ncbi:MAG TPA: SDR family oxidoreductase [Candidatus Eisenbergiella intestinipullorum]|nr:SDR family oxidoreductase [Candidatus Eisenbergiella intestinipullorum]
MPRRITGGNERRNPIGAKSAAENFTRCWALDLAADGVRVNAIAPAPSAQTFGM